jgi:teichoic acid transport system ATP-binding protein
MAARLKFAIASAKTHDILLVDEALATGDAEFRIRSERKIKELRDQAGTVFLVSHSLDVVQETCNRALWLDAGVLKLDGPVEDVIQAYLKSTRAG